MIIHFKKRVLFGLSITLIVLIVLGIFSYLSTQRLIETARLLSHTTRVINHAEQVLKIAIDLETGKRGYVITGDSSFLTPFNQASEKIENNLSLLDSIVREDVIQSERMKKIHVLVNKELDWSLKVINARKNNFEESQALVARGDGKLIMDELRTLIHEIQDHERKLFGKNNTVTAKTLQEFQYSLLTFSLVVIIIILILFYIVNANLQARSKAEKKLIAAAQETKDLYNNAPCGYHSLDSDGFFVSINNTLLQWLGYEREDLINKLKFSDILSKESAEVFRTNFLKFKKDGQINDLEFDLIKKDGSKFPVLLNAKALYDPQGNYINSRSTTFDNSERIKSDKRIREIIESAPDAMVIVDKHGKIQLVNRQTEKIFLYNRDELIGKPVEMLIPNTKRGLHKNHVKKYFEQPTNRPMGVGLELLGLRKNGDTFPVEISLSPIDGTEGTFVTAAIRDITERKQAEKIMGEMASIVAFTEEAIISTTPDGQVISWNNGAEKLYGYTSTEIIGKHIKTIIPVDLIDEELKIFKQVNTGTPTKNYETTRIKKDGGRLDISLTISPIRNKEGKIIGLSKIAHDISERKRKEEEILFLNKELESFTYSVSHDLRAPLRSIHGYSQILIDDYGDKIDEEGKRVTQVIINNAKRMGQLIDDLLDFSRLSRKDLSFSHTNMNQVVNQAIKELNVNLDDGKITIVINELIPTKMDRSMILQVWINLISNAIKYAQQREEIKIEINSYIDKNEICYRISDNGTGFDMKYVDKLFNVFQRLHKIHEYHGTGVGLAIVKRIINKHGGRVWAEGQLNKGATFYFSLP